MSNQIQNESELRVPKGATEEALLAYLFLKYPAYNKEELFDLLISEKKLWAQNCFPKEFAIGIREIKKVSKVRLR